MTAWGSEVNMKAPNPELIDGENPEWTDDMFAKAIPFSALPADQQKLLSEKKHVVPDAKKPSKRQPAA
jgi:hypothetical protein